MKLELDKIQEGQFFDVTYKAGNSQKLYTVKNLQFRSHNPNTDYILFEQSTPRSSRTPYGSRNYGIPIDRIVSLIERKQPLQVGDIVQYDIDNQKPFERIKIGVITELNSYYKNPIDFKTNVSVYKDVEIVTLNQGRPERVLVYSWTLNKRDYLQEAEQILLLELVNIKQQLNKIREKKKLSMQIARNEIVY